MGPKIAAVFNTIDSFDTHARIPEYFGNVDKAAKEGGKIGIISVGWDPGMFSLRNKCYRRIILVKIVRHCLNCQIVSGFQGQSGEVKYFFL